MPLAPRLSWRPRKLCSRPVSLRPQCRSAQVNASPSPRRSIPRSNDTPTHPRSSLKADRAPYDGPKIKPIASSSVLYTAPSHRMLIGVSIGSTVALWCTATTCVRYTLESIEQGQRNYVQLVEALTAVAYFVLGCWYLRAPMRLVKSITLLPSANRFQPDAMVRIGRGLPWGKDRTITVPAWGIAINNAPMIAKLRSHPPSSAIGSVSGTLSVIGTAGGRIADVLATFRKIFSRTEMLDVKIMDHGSYRIDMQGAQIMR